MRFSSFSSPIWLFHCFFDFVPWEDQTVTDGDENEI